MYAASVHSVSRALVLVVVLAGMGGAGCHATASGAPAKSGETATAESSWVVDRLYLGRSIEGGGAVTDEAWETFLADTVTPKIPAGFTVFRARGQWRSESGAVAHEDSFVLEWFHKRDESARATLTAIGVEYKRRFHQQSVLHVTQAARVSFE